MPSPLPIIIDTDPGVDDALALLFAAASPEVEVLAVTTVAGNIGLERTTDNARRVLPIAWEGRPVPPLYRGGTGGPETAEHVHGTDGLGGITALLGEDGGPLYPPAAPVASQDAVDAILSLAEARPGEVTLVTLGPLTNAAKALRRNAAAMRKLREVVVMGGAFREPGNVSPAAEFNIFVDPEAAQTLCDSGLSVRWVPLDVTHRCLLLQEHLDSLPDTARARFARQATEFYIRHHRLLFGEAACFLHDPLAVGAVIWRELLESVPLRVNVETQGRFTTGMTVGDFRPSGSRGAAAPNAQVCLEVDAEAFVRRFVERLA